MPLVVELTTEQRVLLTINPQTQAGRPAQIDGNPEISVIGGDGTFSAHESGDPKKAWLNSGEVAGDTVFLVRADARVGPEVIDISDTVTLRVRTPEAVNIGLSVGDPEPEPV